MEITVFKVFVDVQGHIGVVLLVRLMEILVLELESKQMNVLLAFSLLLLPLLLRCVRCFYATCNKAGEV